MRRNSAYTGVQIFFWVSTIVFHMYTRSSLIASAGMGQFLLEVFVRNLLLSALVYFNLIVLIPKLARRQKGAVYSIILCAALLVYALLKDLHDIYLGSNMSGSTNQFELFHNTFYNLSIASFYVAFSIAIELSGEWYQQRELIRRIELEKLNTELEYLKAQINPHFLFNSINTIYFQIEKQNKVAREILSSFSDMLRYQLYECNGKFIPIEMELRYIQNYVNLQRMRMDDNCIININATPEVSGFSIAPLLLIPFVENAFKHVAHHPLDNQIRISFGRTQDLFIMNVFNNKEQIPNAESSPGIGLKNVKRRLELLYPGSHDIHVDEDSDWFDVTLSLQLNNQH